MNPYGVTDEKVSALHARMDACGVAEADLDESFVRSSGPGGQHVNRVATCVVLKHAPSGHVVKMQQARSQALNRYYARKRLCELLEGGVGQDRAAEKIRKQKARRKRRSRKKADSGSEGKKNTPR